MQLQVQMVGIATFRSGPRIKNCAAQWHGANQARKELGVNVLPTLGNLGGGWKRDGPAPSGVMIS